MNLHTIDAAIQHHLDWITNFNAAFSGTTLPEFDLQKAGNDRDCSLGRWLATPESLELLGEDFHKRTIALHGTFHEIAGEIANSLNANDPSEVTQGLIDALADLSKSLVEFLEFARKQLGGHPRNWAI